MEDSTSEELGSARSITRGDSRRSTRRVGDSRQRSHAGTKCSHAWQIGNINILAFIQSSNELWAFL